MDQNEKIKKEILYLTPRIDRLVFRARGPCLNVRGPVIELEFLEVLVFVVGGNWRTRRETLGAEREPTTNSTHVHETPSTGIELGSQRWEASAYPLRNLFSLNVDYHKF